MYLDEDIENLCSLSSTWWWSPASMQWN